MGTSSSHRTTKSLRYDSPHSNIEMQPVYDCRTGNTMAKEEEAAAATEHSNLLAMEEGEATDDLDDISNTKASCFITTCLHIRNTLLFALSILAILAATILIWVIINRISLFCGTDISARNWGAGCKAFILVGIVLDTLFCVIFCVEWYALREFQEGFLACWWKATSVMLSIAGFLNGVALFGTLLFEGAKVVLSA